MQSPSTKKLKMGLYKAYFQRQEKIYCSGDVINALMFLHILLMFTEPNLVITVLLVFP